MQTISPIGRSVRQDAVPSRRHRFSSVAKFLWLAMLAGALVISAHSTYEFARKIQEYAYSCDPFGYLLEARQLRTAVRNLQVPHFGLESPQTQLLIDFMKSHNVPLSSWRLLVAPHANLYFPKSQRIGVQYPPGTGLVLAMFPEGKAVFRLNKTVVYLFVVAGLAVLVVTARLRTWFSAGLVVLSLLVGLEAIPLMGTLSFSINALLPVLLVAFVLIFLAFEKSNPARRFIFISVSGVLFGLAILIRLPVLLISPGVLVLLWPRQWRPWMRNPLIVFGVSAMLTGVLPVLAFQQQETGAWFVSTYGPADTSPPTLSVIARNIHYYLGSGPGNTGMLALELATVGAVGIFLLYRVGDSTDRLGWKRIGGAVLVLWGSSTAYFLTHRVTTAYYALPGTFAALFALAFGSFIFESRGDLPRQRWIQSSPIKVLTLTCALIPGIYAIATGWWPLIRPEQLTLPPQHHFTMPAELSDAKAWVWADFLSGTFWYYGNKPAFRIGFSDPSTRALLYQFVYDRGEPQYLVDDSPFMAPLMKEISDMGGTLERRTATVDDSPYFLVQWPQGGPLHRASHK